MKRILQFSVFLLLTGLSYGQTKTDCSIFKTGNFSYFDSSNNTVFVKRKTNRQSETNFQTKEKTVSKVRWISDCEYELTQTWTSSKAKRKYNGSKLIVMITKAIAGNQGYEYSCRCEDKTVNLKNSGIMRREVD